VSFLGTTGSGKSKLIRMLLGDGVPKPISGDPQEDIATSSDIHAYIGDFSNNAQLTFSALMLDCEGAGGAHKPQTLSVEAIEEEFGKRIEFVKAYPRLLYVLSDVVCFVTTLGRRAIEEIANTLETYVSQAASATVNQHHLPSLLLIFNKVALSEGKWNFEMASSGINQHPKLKRFFHKVIVVCIFCK
jgi:hypothetical protein